MNSELNQSVILEAEVLGIQNVAQTDHSKLDNLDFEHSGHTGFQPAGNYVEDSNYTHTDNNYTTEEKTKLSNLENYDDTEIKRDIQNLEDTKVDREVNKGLSTNDYTNEEKSKLASLENYDDTEVKADISALEDIETTQNQEIVNIKANKADKSEIPDVSDFITNSVNDLINYYLKSETYTKTEVNNLIGAINQFHYEIVQALPITGETNILYLVPKSTSETENIYDEYVYASGWEKIGDTEIDLSNYVTTTQLNTALADYTTTANLTTLLAGKQNTIDSTHKLDADLVDDSLSTNKFVSATDKTTWNGKQDALVSGTNIKTINNQSILGSGDLPVSGYDGDLPVFLIGENNESTQTIKIDLSTAKKGLYKLKFKPLKIQFTYNNTNLYSEMVVADDFIIFEELDDANINDKIALLKISYPNNKIYQETWVYKTNNNHVWGSISIMGAMVYPPIGLEMYEDKNSTITAKFQFTGDLPESSIVPTTNDQFTNKKYVDDLPTTYTGYDATKTQVLKNINGTLTWVDE